MKAALLALVPVLPTVVWGLKAYWAKQRVNEMRERWQEKKTVYGPSLPPEMLDRMTDREYEEYVNSFKEQRR